MKKARHVTGWTDYPIVELGDTPGQKAPIRKVEVIGYDGNKYAEVTVFAEDGTVIQTNFKAGYIYGKPGRCGQVRAINTDKIRVAFGHDTLARYYAKRGTRIRRLRGGMILFLNHFD